MFALGYCCQCPQPVFLFISRRSNKHNKEVKKRSGGFNKVCSLSPLLQEFIGEAELARTEVMLQHFVMAFLFILISYQANVLKKSYWVKKILWSHIFPIILISCVWFQVVKRIWAYIRENSLQDPSNRRKILCDERMQNLFSVKSIDMFQMNKALSKHIWPLDSEGDITSNWLNSSTNWWFY